MSDNHSALLGIGILFLLALPVYLIILSIVLNLFKIDTAFHFFPLILNSIAFGTVGLFLGVAVDFKERHFLISEKIKNNEYHHYFLDPYGMKQEEVATALNAKYKENGYKKKHIIGVIVFLTLGLVILLIAIFINSIFLSALVTYPLAIIAGIVFSLSVAEENYLDEVAPRWKECLCPKCQALCSYYSGKTTDHKEKSEIYTYTQKTTDKITDGYNTAYVEREQQRLGVKSTSYWKTTYYCKRCKSQFTKEETYTKYGGS